VARPQWLRNAVFGLILGGAVHFLNIDFEAIGLEVFDPLGAASATADFLDGDLWARRRESHGHQQSGRTEESPRYFHIASMELYPCRHGWQTRRDQMRVPLPGRSLRTMRKIR
jgi:hypothetical protein